MRRPLSAAWAAARQRATPQPTRRSLRVAVYYILVSILDEIGAFIWAPVQLGSGVRALDFQGFRPFGASKSEIFSGLAGAERHRREIGPEYPSATPKRRNRAAATRPRVSSGVEKKRDLQELSLIHI